MLAIWQWGFGVGRADHPFEGFKHYTSAGGFLTVHSANTDRPPTHRPESPRAQQTWAVLTTACIVAGKNPDFAKLITSLPPVDRALFPFLKVGW